MTIYVDSSFDDRERAAACTPATLCLLPTPEHQEPDRVCATLIEEAFSPLNPEHAQHSLPVERFSRSSLPSNRASSTIRGHGNWCGRSSRIWAWISRRRTRRAADARRTSDGYLTAGVAYVLHPHRDIWYSSPPCQLNWWLPVFPFESESSFAFHPRYWSEPAPNSSSGYNHYEWNNVGRAQAHRRPPSTPASSRSRQRRSADPEVRIVCEPGGSILFSGAQLHSTVPNPSGRSRFSVDFRTAHHDEPAHLDGAPAIDRACRGTTLFELRRASDLRPVPEESSRSTIPFRRPDRPGVIFKPPVSVT